MGCWYRLNDATREAERLMQENHIARLTAVARGHSAAIIEDSARHDYAALTFLVPAQTDCASAMLESPHGPFSALAHRQTVLLLWLVSLTLIPRVDSLIKDAS
jgi:hypothetical protein